MLARFFLFAAAICLVTAPTVFADTEDCNWGRVVVRVLPTVAVYYTAGDVNMGSIQALDQVCATLRFTVHANGQSIRLRCGASKLFKDDIPSSTWWIPVDVLTQARMTAEYGQSNAGLPTLTTTASAGPLGMVALNHTEWFNFASGDGGSWSYWVDIYICWKGANAQLFQGNYSGAVVLWAMYVDI